MSNNSMRDMFKLSFGEEVGNSVSHGVMAALILLFLPISTIYAYTRAGLALGLSTGIYMISIFLMFLCSCVYHSMEFGSSQKYVMRILDHCAIFVAIAGTYTPILVHLVGGYFGYGLLILQWVVTIVGIIATAASKNYHKKLSLTLSASCNSSSNTCNVTRTNAGRSRNHQSLERRNGLLTLNVTLLSELGEHIFDVTDLNTASAYGEIHTYKNKQWRKNVGVHLTTDGAGHINQASH